MTRLLAFLIPSFISFYFNKCPNGRVFLSKKNNVGNKISSIDKNYTFEIRDRLNCGSENLVYMLECGMCGKQYVGETSTPFRYRFNNHKCHINSSKHLPIPKHVHIQQHPFQNFKVFLLKSGFSSAKERLAFESYLIRRFKTDTLGLNIDGGILKKYFSET
jgi:hypothetical protein